MEFYRQLTGIRKGRKGMNGRHEPQRTRIFTRRKNNSVLEMALGSKKRILYYS
jgi:hypothetical protein